jgi:hypothetical protein
MTNIETFNPQSMPDVGAEPTRQGIFATTATSATLDDDSIRPDYSGENPYPGADNRVWTDRFAKALATYTGLPRDVTDGIAPYVVRPKTYLSPGRGDAPDALQPAALKRNATGQMVLAVAVHGFAGNAGEYNERIRSSYDSPVKPGANLDHVLPGLVTGSTSSGELAPFITTADPVSFSRLNILLGVMNRALDDADGERGYNLAEDIEIYGQLENTLHVPLLRKIAEPDDAGGNRVRSVVDLTAVKGANRSRARLKLFGIKPENILFGVKPKTIMSVQPRGEEETPSADSRRWVPALANLLHTAYGDPTHPGHMVARRAATVATVTMEIIIGSPVLEEFHNTVFDPNRVDHRRPPLDYKMAEKAASDLRALLRDYKARGFITEEERAWLAGEGTDPSPVLGEKIVDARDRRDRALLDVVFPPPQEGAEISRWQRARIVLGEPARGQTGRKHVDNRLRMYSAVASDGYTTRWNPRVLDGLLGSSSIKEQTTFHGLLSWRQLTAAAEVGNFKDLDTFLITRGMHWLAEFGLVEADRGSVGAQTSAVGGQGEETRERLIRRTMSNVRTAMLEEPLRAFGLLRELARAVEMKSLPRTVDDSGCPVDGTRATRVWFNEAFPKTTRRRPAPDPLSEDTKPVQPDLNPQQELLLARDSFEVAVTEKLVSAYTEVFSAARDLVIAASAAGQNAFPDGNGHMVESVERALLAAKTDVNKLFNELPSLKYGGAASEQFNESACESYILAKAE